MVFLLGEKGGGGLLGRGGKMFSSDVSRLRNPAGECGREER